MPQLLQVSSGLCALPPRTSLSQPAAGQKRTLGSLRSLRRLWAEDNALAGPLPAP